MQLDRGPDALAVANSLRRIVHGLRKSAYVVEHDLGISGAQLFVLKELAVAPNVSIRKLSELTLTDPSSVSVVVARLVQNGLVARRKDEADARSSVLSLTARGRSLLRRAPEPFQARLIEALQSLPRSRVQQLRKGLVELEGALGTKGAPPMFFDEAPRSKRKAARSGT